MPPSMADDVMSIATIVPCDAHKDVRAGYVYTSCVHIIIMLCVHV